MFLYTENNSAENSHKNMEEETVKLNEVEVQEVKPLEATEESTTAVSPYSNNKDSSLLFEVGPELFFKDGKRKIDYIIVYKDNGKNKEAEVEDTKKAEARKIFQKNLKKEGLELEIEEEAGLDLTFVKIHAPWSVLTRYADTMHIKMPIRDEVVEEFRQSAKDFMPVQELVTSKNLKERVDKEKQETAACPGVKSCLRGVRGKIDSVFSLDEEVVPAHEDHSLYCSYKRRQEHLFRVENKDTFFNNSTRSYIVNFILERKWFSNTDEGFKFGITRLISEGIYQAAYPLHEGSLKPTARWNMRRMLKEEWASFKKLFYYQPTYYIKTYFGERIALYFAWLGFYTLMLVLPSIIGLLCFLYGVVTIMSDPTSDFICNEGSKIVMCPLCDATCDYWKLGGTCNHARASHIFDNAWTVFFALFMSLWGVIFLELWLNVQHWLRVKWNIADKDDSSGLKGHPRPAYLAQLHDCPNINPVTKEPYLPFWTGQLPRFLCSVSSVVFMIAIVLAIVLGVIVYRMAVSTVLHLHSDTLLSNNAGMIVAATAASLNLIFILILNMLYERLAIWLTDLETLRTQQEHDDSLALKIFIFQFVNYFSSIFYIAFFKGRTSGTPNEYNRLFNYRQEECSPGGCLIELCIQLGIIFVGKQFVMNNIMEIVFPRLKRFVMVYLMGLEEKEIVKTQHIKDYSLSEFNSRTLFSEYLEMGLQFGFLTIFVAAFPLAPIFALINNILEIRIDANKILTQFRRPVAIPTKSIGIWFHIIDGISKIAIITNAFIIAFTSDFIPRLVYAYGTKDRALGGYVNASLSFFDVKDLEFQPNNPMLDGVTVTACRYKDFRHPPGSPREYDKTEMWWHVMAARLAFVVLFENLVVCMRGLLRLLIPDIPQNLKYKVAHEKLVENELMMEAELDQARKDAAAALATQQSRSSASSDYENSP